jgi:hypothetical protein
VNIRPYAKAACGAVLAGLTAAGTALADGRVSALEAVGIAVAVVGTGGTVFGVRNGAKPRVRRARKA